MDLARIAILYALGMELSAWVKLARTKKGLTQDQMADALGVTKGNVSAWENGRHEPSWAKILKIGHLTGEPLPIPPELQTPIPKETAELIDDLRLLSQEDRTMMVFQVKRLADLTSEKVNSVTAEKSGTIGSRSDALRESSQPAIKHGVTSLDQAVREAESIFGVKRASSTTTTGKVVKGGKS